MKKKLKEKAAQGLKSVGANSLWWNYQSIDQSLFISGNETHRAI